MKRHLQCAEQQASPSNLTKYCACHAKWPPNIWQKFAENSWNVISNARPIRDRSDPENANRNPPRHRGYFSHSPGADSIKNHNVSRSGYHSKFHHMLRLPRKVTHEVHQMLWPRKVTHELHQMLRLPRKVTHKLHQMLRLPRKVTHELHQMLRLPRKVNLMIDPHHIWNIIYNARSNSQHPRTSPNTAPATQNDHPTSDRNLVKTAETSFPMRDRSETVPTQRTQTATRRATEATFRTRQEQILLKITTFPAPAIIPNFTTCCACHEKWHMNFTKCCTCHKKWHMNFTKCCTCHKKWHEMTHDYYYY